MDIEIKKQINKALEGLSQQKAYNIISEYKYLFKKMYPMVEEQITYAMATEEKI